MIYSKLNFVFLTILSKFFINYASASKMEEIIGAYPAFQTDFKYQAALVGKYNYSNVPYLVGGAGIISDYLLISAARCFIQNNYAVRKFTFFAVVGVDVLMTKDIVLREVEEFYTFYYSDFWIEHDMAFVRLKHSLNLQNNTDVLSRLEIPQMQENFHGQIGIVAGFGIDSIIDLRKQPSRETVRMTVKNTRFLKYAMVTIFTSESSIYDTDFVCEEVTKYFTEICGIIVPDETYDYRGICMGDAGSPLVIGNKVIGIASKHSKVCDDGRHGTVYTKVSKFKIVIDAIISGVPLNGTSIFKNVLHIPNSKGRYGEISTV